MDEFHLLLKEEQTAAYSVEIWKRFRKWGGIPTGITQNVKDLLSSREVTNIFENSDFIYMLNQAAGDRQILADQLNISPVSYTHLLLAGGTSRTQECFPNMADKRAGSVKTQMCIRDRCAPVFERQVRPDPAPELQVHL